MPSLEEVVPKPETRVSLLVDNSSSMKSISKFVVDTYNEQIDELKKIKDQKITVTLIFFDSDVDVRMFNVPLSEIENLEYDEYVPCGMTALDDATGIAIDKFRTLKDHQDKNVSHLCLIITDGYGNTNKEYSKQSIASMIGELQKTNWTFTYLGANVNVEKVAKDYNLSVGNTMSYTADVAGVQRSSQVTSRGLENYFMGRSKGIRSMSSFYDDVKDDKKSWVDDNIDNINEDSAENEKDAQYDIDMGNPDLNKNAIPLKEEQS